MPLQRMNRRNGFSVGAATAAALGACFPFAPIAARTVPRRAGVCLSR